MKEVVTKTALKRFHKTVDYLEEEWGEAVAIQFEKRTSNFLDLVADFPDIGPEVNAEKSIRAFQLTKQTRVYYRYPLETLHRIN